MFRRSNPRFGGGATELIEKWNRKNFYRTCVGGAVGSGALIATDFTVAGGTLGVLTALFSWRGYKDITQTRSTLLRTFPVLAHARYLLEGIRGEIRQYLIEDDTTPNPFSREMRTLIYSRAKSENDTIPFGTRRDLYEPGAEYVLHSMYPKEKIKFEGARQTIGLARNGVTKPYSASLLNVSAMSYGALSHAAIRALNGGSQLAGCYHNSGEGSVSPFHLDPANSGVPGTSPHVVWNIGTGYFGCRNDDGSFSMERFMEMACRDEIKMIEIKLSQGAKPGKGGVLPASKNTPTIAKIRGLKPWTACYSPARHSSFDSPETLLEFAAKLRAATGKPVGAKMCVGDPVELAMLVRACRATDMYLDFITVDGSEGGTGAAPVEFQNRMGTPLTEGLYMVHNMLRGAGIRDRTRIICSGKIYSGFTVLRALTLGADITNSARAMMMATGCIQSLECHTGTCPTGIATQDEDRIAGLHIPDKRVRVANFHRKTVEATLDLVAACGFSSLDEVRSRPVIMARTDPSHAQFLNELYPKLKHEELLSVPITQERLASSIQGQSFKDRLTRAWIISGDERLQPKIRLYAK